MTTGEVVECGLCGSDNLQTILDMGEQPIAERLDSHETYPLVLLRCWDCMLVQLSYIVDEKELFPLGHPYTTGTTKVLVEHFHELTKELSADLSPGDLVVDIGANDGTLLGGYPPTLVRVGIEPTDQVAKLVGKGLHGYQSYFSSDVAHEVVDRWGQAKVITATNVFAHVPDPHDFMEGVEYLLADDGVFVVENQFLGSITEGLQFDTVYHEHLRYYSAETITRLIGMHGFQVEQIMPIAIHGGSIQVRARKRHVSDLETRVMKAASQLYHLVRGAEGPIYGVAAATRTVPLIHYANIAPFLQCVCEVSASEKIGRKIPGTNIPIVDERKLIEDQPPHALIFVWQLKDSIIPKLQNAGYKGKFIIPLPEPKVVTGVE